jgi:AhpD family alkylhydroperoxidase
MSRIPLPATKNPADDDVIRAFSLSPAFARAMSAYSKAIYGAIKLSMREREAARMRIAQINQCQLCLGFRFPELAAQGVTEAFYAEIMKWRSSTALSTREKLAIEYAERFLTNHLHIDDNFFAALNAQFSPDEVFELTAIIAGLMANGRVMQVLQLDQNCSL